MDFNVWEGGGFSAFSYYVGFAILTMIDLQRDNWTTFCTRVLSSAADGRRIHVEDHGALNFTRGAQLEHGVDKEKDWA